MPNPCFNISIQIKEDQKEWLEIMKSEFRSRVTQGYSDYFSLFEIEDGNLVLVFSPTNYAWQKEMLESFEEMVMKPTRQRAELKQKG